MDKKINTETRKLKIEIEMPYVYYEALIANPSIKNNMMLERIDRAVLEALSKSYHNPRVLPTAVKQYLEDKYGKPIIPNTKTEETQTVDSKKNP